MKRRIAVLLALATPCLGAGDWPQWRGPGRDGVLPSFRPPAAWPPQLAVSWQAKVGVGHASPVLAGGRVFVFSREGESEVLRALDLATGRQAWRQAYPAPYRMNPAAEAHGEGPKATPVVGGGRVCSFGISGILSCFEAASGRPLWRRDTGSAAELPLYGVAQSPLLDGGRLIVHVGGSGSGALTAFDAATGTPLWTWKGDGPAYASPVAAEVAGVRQVVAFSESNLVSVSVERGERLWGLPFTTPWVQNSVTPIVDGDRVIYSGLDHPVRALRIVKGAAGFATQPLWENEAVSAYMSSPVLAAGRVFGLSNRKKGQLFCLDAATGRTLWLSDGRQGENAALVAAGGLLLVLTTEADLIVAPQAGDAFSATRRYRVAPSPTWAHPALLDGGVLVKDVDSLIHLRF